MPQGEREPGPEEGELAIPVRADAVRKYRKALRRKMDVTPDQKEPLLIEHLQKMERLARFDHEHLI